MKLGIMGLGIVVSLFVCLLMVSMVPVMAASPNVIAVNGGSSHSGSSVALLDDGTVWTWGNNYFGGLGDGDTQNAFTPVKLNMSNVTTVANGYHFMLALKNDGTIWGWGKYYPGNLGTDHDQEFLTPIQITGVDNVVRIAVGTGDCFALEKDGSLWAWGSDLSGELGIGRVVALDPNNTPIIYTPVKVDIDNVKDIECAEDTTYILKNDGTVWASGDGSLGQLGNGGTGSSDTFVQVPITNVTSISSGNDDVLAIKDDGTVWSWGNNRNYQTGSDSAGSYQPVPSRVGNIGDVVEVSGGGCFSLALKRDGTVWVWGRNQECIYGTKDGWGPDSYTPVQISGLNHIKAISAGTTNCFAIKDDGTLWGWGADSVGEVGVGTFIPAGTNSPIQDNYTPSTISPFPSVYFPTQVLFDQPDRVYYQPSPDSATPTPFSSAFPMPAASSNFSISAKWSTTNNPMDYIAAGDNGSLYAFGNNTVYRYGSDGSLEWSLPISEQWRICTNWTRPSNVQQSIAMIQQLPPEPIYAIQNGSLYLYATPNTTIPSTVNGYQNEANLNVNGLSWELFAISSDGKISWSVPLKTDITPFDDTMIKAVGNYIYVFHCYNETVFDQQGNVVLNIPNVSDPAAIDETGVLYFAPAESRYWQGVNQYSDNNTVAEYADFRTPGNTLEALYPNGSVYWQKDLGQSIVRQYLVDEAQEKYSSVPILQNHTLYLVLNNSLMALNYDGSVKWTRPFDNGSYNLLDLMPIDSHGNIYLRSVPISGSGQTSTLEVIGPDGKDVCHPRAYTDTYSICYRSAAKDGILYQMSPIDTGDSNVLKPLSNESLNYLSPTAITAYDIINGTVLWSYELPNSDKHETTIDVNNIDGLLYMAREDRSSFLDTTNEGIKGVASDNEISVYPSGDIVYVSYSLTNYEAPVVYGLSKCVYSSGIIALNIQGTPIMEKQANSPISMMAVNNSTVFFLTGDGKISSLGVGIALVGGIAILALAALAAKFFLFGSVTRGRKRVDKNMNRNAVMQFIVENPGFTMYDIANKLKMNMGTVRYHLFILAMNHKVTTFKDDSKYVRYFPNSNRYSHDEQMIISLMRRETMSKIIGVLNFNTSITNNEICAKTGLSDSTVSKFAKELFEKGVVSKELVTPNRYAYRLTEKSATIIGNLEKRLGSENILSSFSGSSTVEAL